VPPLWAFLNRQFHRDSAVNAAATFNRGLIYQRGVAMGAEWIGKGVNVALGPMMNPARVAAGGRNWEGFGAGM
jgi:beta-glucosidase-like glycosyl hydrolase